SPLAVIITIHPLPFPKIWPFSEHISSTPTPQTSHTPTRRRSSPLQWPPLPPPAAAPNPNPSRSLFPQPASMAALHVFLLLLVFGGGGSGARGDDVSALLEFKKGISDRR
uniref:Uncharacterized protein n=1 Tax=Aegilops tauschii subsp. strangulata TaxID=200361 RepID=A0A453B176_AEGTS